MRAAHTDRADHHLGGAASDRLKTRGAVAHERGKYHVPRVQVTSQGTPRCTRGGPRYPEVLPYLLFAQPVVTWSLATATCHFAPRPAERHPARFYARRRP